MVTLPLSFEVNLALEHLVTSEQCMLFVSKPESHNSNNMIRCSQEIRVILGIGNFEAKDRGRRGVHVYVPLCVWGGGSRYWGVC